MRGTARPRVGVLLGGVSREREISLKSGDACRKALDLAGYPTVAIDAGPDLPDALRAQQVAVAFIALHGRFGEDGTVQALLEYLRVPYTGSGVTASALTFDKSLIKGLLRGMGVPTPEWVTLWRPQGVADAPSAIAALALPVIVKPAREGSTLGVTLVREIGALPEAIATAYGHDDHLLVEQFIAGREVTVGIVQGEPLPVIEIRPRAEIFDYESKYTAGATEYLVPAPLPAPLIDRCQTLSVGVYEAFRCAGVARVDLMITPTGEPYVLEINTVPGMTETSLVPKAARAAGMSFPDLVERIMASAGLDKG